MVSINHNHLFVLYFLIGYIIIILNVEVILYLISKEEILNWVKNDRTFFRRDHDHSGFN